MFSKDGNSGGSGSAHMFAAALKMMGLQPEVIEQLSKGLLLDLKTVANTQPEILARLEFLLRCSDPPRGMEEADTGWEAYLAVRRAEFDRQHGSALGGGGPNTPAVIGGNNSGGSNNSVG